MSEALFFCLADRKYWSYRLHSFIQHKHIDVNSWPSRELCEKLILGWEVPFPRSHSQ